jgi:hypothetical protein
MWEAEEKFSKAHPLNLKIRDADVFLHGTSIKKYSAIQSTGFLLRNAPKNFSISQAGICFEKYEHGKFLGTDAKGLVERTLQGYCNTTCRNDQSKEGIILEIKGKELKTLGCRIYADWNKAMPYVYDDEGRPEDIDYDSPVISIIITDCDIPIRFLEVVKKVIFKD